MTAGAGALVATSTFGGCQDLPGGPSLTVTVSSAGLVSIWADATVNDSGAGASGPYPQLYIHEPTDLPGCGLLVGDTGSGQRAAHPLGWVNFRATPGTRTYTLRYGRLQGGGGSTGQAGFVFRTLWVMPY